MMMMMMIFVSAFVYFIGETFPFSWRNSQIRKSSDFESFSIARSEGEKKKS
jgi:hypothetical protein